MIEAVVVTWSMMVAFILSSAERNRREARDHAPALLRYGRVLMAASFTASGLLFGWAGMSALSA